MSDINTDLINIPLILIHNNEEIYNLNTAFFNLLSMRKEAIVGLNFRDIDFLKPIEKQISTAIITRKSHIQRYSFKDKYFEVSIFPFTFEDIDLTSLLLYDISPFLTIEEELLKRNRELMIMNTLSGAFISSDNIEGVVNELLEKILLITEFSIGWIMIKSDEKFELKTQTGISKSFLRKITEDRINKFCKNLETLDDPLHIYEESEIKNLSPFDKEGICFLAAVPIKVGSAFKGIMFLASHVGKTFDFNFASLLSLIGSQLTLIFEKIELFEETQRLSITDSLTGLFNSRFFYQALEKEIARANRYNRTFSLGIFDIDNFKDFNDTYGHQIGDEVLKNVASILQEVSRKTDIVARYGGEEFVIIFPNTPKKDALAVSERILKNAHSYSFLPKRKQTVKITLSGGISSFPEDGTTAKNLLYTSDVAMYEAKSLGKKKIVCYNGVHEKNIQKA